MIQGSHEIHPFKPEAEIISQELTFPQKIMTKENLGYLAMHIMGVLLDNHNGLEAYTIVKQAEELTKVLIENLKDKALQSATGKEGEVLGAKYQIKQTRKYEHNAPTLASLDNDVTVLKARMKLIKNVIEGGETFVDVETGIENTAKLISVGAQISITLPKA